MTLSEVADRLILNGSVEGNVFPKEERDVLFPLTIKPEAQDITVHGSIYARAIDIEPGNVLVHGPIASRGDILVHQNAGRFQAMGGITTLSGLVIGQKNQSANQLVHNCNECRGLIKGDIVSNQSIVLNNCVVFGSIKAVNCTITNSIILGTVHCEDHLTIQMSSLGGYVSREVNFEGVNMLFNALGESRNRPNFLPYEDSDGSIISASLHLYSAARGTCGMRMTTDLAKQHTLSILYPDVDWINVHAQTNETSDQDPVYADTWVLSLGGRIADYSKLSDATNTLSELLRIGFEFSHYSPEVKRQQLDKIRPQLTEGERAILDSVCI
ncbi:polymer-forming cytoskeletal family protein [Synechococcus sp. MIT S9220]|uniref:polymer-forming cytoskeletal protein n=1 Tax=unclassified Synechococcus TaxID=2626047 RepID=UPI00164C3AAC|nr:polymer-forming cytoskeletal protein [Synechococcus sp. MIT S9220]NOL48411.1 polymer-forming cytoskeletal protein [Synechococcus sp. MIT S9220]QNJ24130.1 polymer-forming cytoskeletal family protein [Synechococcus sp. MIT S9220]